MSITYECFFSPFIRNDWENNRKSFLSRCVIDCTNYMYNECIYMILELMYSMYDKEFISNFTALALSKFFFRSFACCTSKYKQT